jgi:hypothetical protein
MKSQLSLREMMGFFPRRMGGVSPLVITNTADELCVVYALKGVKDPEIDWEKYHDWIKNCARIRAAHNGGDDPKCIKYCESIMPTIYWENIPAFDRELLTENDTALISFEIMGLPSDQTVMLSRIDRRIPVKGADGYKGDGAKLYQKIAEFVKARGQRFIHLVPENEKLNPYWRSQGLFDLEEVRPEKMREIERGEIEGMVHFLYEEDKPQFLK